MNGNGKGVLRNGRRAPIGRKSVPFAMDRSCWTQKRTSRISPISVARCSGRYQSTAKESWLKLHGLSSGHTLVSQTETDGTARHLTEVALCALWDILRDSSLADHFHGRSANVRRHPVPRGRICVATGDKLTRAWLGRGIPDAITRPLADLKHVMDQQSARRYHPNGAESRRIRGMVPTDHRLRLGWRPGGVKIQHSVHVHESQRFTSRPSSEVWERLAHPRKLTTTTNNQ